MCIGYWLGGVAPCSGDSGSGILLEFQPNRYMIVGIVSGGATKCGIANQPAVAIDFNYYRKWYHRNGSQF